MKFDSQANLSIKKVLKRIHVYILINIPYQHYYYKIYSLVYIL